MCVARTTVLFLSLFLLAGCGESWGTAQGTVALEGKQLIKGVVGFHPVGDGATAYGTLTDAGTFIVMTGAKPGLQPGDYVVTVVDQTIPKMGTGETAKLLTPEKYASAATSDLKITIQPGVNQLELVLKK